MSGTFFQVLATYWPVAATEDNDKFKYKNTHGV
jgi:hypothetical protein